MLFSMKDYKEFCDFIALKEALFLLRHLVM